MGTPKVTVEEKQEQILKQCAGAERGQDGLRRVTVGDFKMLTNAQKTAVLTEPFVLTSDTEDVHVIMTVEQYFAFRPPRSVPGRVARTVRIEGVFYRECI